VVQKTQELNKATKDKSCWVLAPLTCTKLGAWAGDAFRYLESCDKNFDPADEYDSTIRKGIHCNANYVCLVIAKFFQLREECTTSNMDSEAAEAAAKQNAALSSYLSIYQKYSMIPKACPLFIVTERNELNSAHQGRFLKACSDARRLSDLIGSMRSISDLLQILNNFIPMGADASMDSKSKATICQSAKVAFEKFDGGLFKSSDGTKVGGTICS